MISHTDNLSLIYENGQLEYDGKFQAGKRHGQGSLIMRVVIEFMTVNGEHT